MKFALTLALLIVSSSSFAALLCKSPTSADLKITYQADNKLLVEMVGDTRPVRGLFYGELTSMNETPNDRVAEYKLSGPRGGGKITIKNDFKFVPDTCRSPRACGGMGYTLETNFKAELDYVGLSYFTCSKI